MNSLKHFLLLLLLILPYSCTDEYITNESNLGNIRGHLVDQYNYGINMESIYISIPGTSVYAAADSAGNFLLMNLPVGTYNLLINYYGPNYDFEQNINNISVTSGNTTVVPDILLDLNNSAYPDFLESLSIVLPNYGDIRLYMNDSSFVDIDAVGGDSLLIRGRLNNNYYQYQTGDTALTIEYDSDLYYVETSKRYFYLKVPVKEEFCQIRVWEGHSIQPNSAFFLCAIFVTERIYTQIELHWNTSYENSAGDFDIHLINNEIQDSCWYENPYPDWGIVGLWEDNPYLNDYTNPNGYYNCNEGLDIDYTPDGTYRLKIVYFSNIFNVNIQVTPEIYLNIDGSYYYYTAPMAMSVGQVWTVLEFNIPSKTVTLINTIGGPGTTGVVRKMK